MRPFRSPDGTMWGVQVQMPSHSGALVLFHHPTGETARLNRYAWINAPTETAHDPRTSLKSADLDSKLSERDVARLFRRSMPIDANWPRYNAS